ncbi:MAG TPA: hypothetical protein VFM94_03470, partial [Solirubrobacterales bacterium]|nr:hypothetical protein [Solirubrobacterales bacterium]
GDEAVEGEPNLYLDEEGAVSFVAVLSEKDLGKFEPGAFALAYDVVARNSRLRATRVSPDGEHLAFQSRAPLTGFDNTDADGKAAVEVFTYEAGGELSCASCNPSGARPRTREMRVPFEAGWAQQSFTTLVHAAAWIPGWERPLYDSKLLSDGGGRLFFNSNDALLPRDTNGAMDVYEWEESGEGGCKESSPVYFPSNDGCLYLISSGESPFESEFWGADPDGSDVFFTTDESLLPRDPDSIDLYDARINGGFPQPVVKEACGGEACQSPPPPPVFGTPSSKVYEGPENVTEGKAKPKGCPKGKRKVRRAGKVRCVAKHHRRARKSGRGER